MEQKILAGYDTREFVLVCRKSDLEQNNVKDGLFLVCKWEWEECNEPIKQFDLLLTKIEKNTVKLYPAPGNAIVIVQSVPYVRRCEYVEYIIE
ncbi:MAG: hypothetical protein SNG81_08155 [Rikenellaceae bacterium]